MADSGKDEGAVGREAEEGAVKRAEDPSSCSNAVGALHAEATPDSILESALLIGFTLPRVALDQVSSKATATAGAVAVPEKLLGLHKRGEEKAETGCKQLFQGLKATPL